MTKTITDFLVSWEADHEQYWQGHGIATTKWDDTATGCGETLREAFEDALEGLAQNGIEISEGFEQDVLSELTAQVESASGLDKDIVEEYCEFNGDHGEEEDPDCSVCASEWHFYVSIDVMVKETV